MEFLTGNPFSTPVGHRIELATNSSLQSEDWTLNMEICDMVNSTDEGPKDAVRAIKKRISGNKNFREVMLALTVLEACVKNCGHRFHILVTTRDFIEGFLVRAIIPKNNPPVVLHDRVLGIIQAWADAFRSSPDLTGVVSVYEHLRRKGLEFPEPDGYSLDNPSNRGLPRNGPASATSKHSLIPLQFPGPKQSQEGASVSLPEQVQRLKTDLGVVQSNLTVMSDMMSQLDPSTAKCADIELLQQLYTVCKDMQNRIAELVPRLSEEKLIEELLTANDEMNSTFTRYQRFERQMTNGQSTTEESPHYVNLSDLSLASNSVSQSGASTNSYPTPSPVDSVCAQMTRLSASEADHLDMQKWSISQTQQRQSEPCEGEVDDQSQGLSATQQNAATIPVSQSSVMEDIEKWLAVEEDDDSCEDSDGVISEEFDRFLAKRAKAAEKLPSITSSSHDAYHSQS